MAKLNRNCPPLYWVLGVVGLLFLCLGLSILSSKVNAASAFDERVDFLNFLVDQAERRPDVLENLPKELAKQLQQVIDLRQKGKKSESEEKLNAISARIVLPEGSFVAQTALR